MKAKYQNPSLCCMPIHVLKVAASLPSPNPPPYTLHNFCTKWKRGPAVQIVYHVIKPHNIFTKGAKVQQLKRKKRKQKKNNKKQPNCRRPLIKLYFIKHILFEWLSCWFFSSKFLSQVHIKTAPCEFTRKAQGLKTPEFLNCYVSLKLENKQKYLTNIYSFPYFLWLNHLNSSECRNCLSF